MKDAQSSEVRQMECEIEDMENHLKLLNDALEDEKQENYKLASDNILLKQQAMPLCTCTRQLCGCSLRSSLGNNRHKGGLSTWDTINALGSIHAARTHFLRAHS